MLDTGQFIRKAFNIYNYINRVELVKPVQLCVLQKCGPVYYSSAQESSANDLRFIMHYRQRAVIVNEQGLLFAYNA